jgi:hypothetical protein
MLGVLRVRRPCLGVKPVFIVALYATLLADEIISQQHCFASAGGVKGDVELLAPLPERLSESVLRG